MLSVIVLSYWMLMIVVNSIPLVGQVVATLLIPVFSVSLMNVCRMIENGAPLVPQLLFSGFYNNLRPLLILGAAYLFAACLIIGASALIDDGALFRLFATGQEPNTESGGGIVVAAQLALVAFAPLMMAYWYAPVLVAWHGVPPAKSLFFSFVACARNWRAFLTYSLALLVFFALVPGLAFALLAAVSHDALGFFKIALTGVVVLVLAPTLYASFYVSYRDVFVTIDENA